MVCTTHHLPLLGHLFDLSNGLLLLVLKPQTFSVKLSNGLVQHALVFPQHLCMSKRQAVSVNRKCNMFISVDPDEPVLQQQRPQVQQQLQQQ